MSAPPKRISPDHHSRIESSYNSYKNSRPHLFQQHGTQAQPMANRTTVQIGVIADNQEHVVSLPNTLYDTSLTHCLITKSKAFATQGQIRTSAPITLTDGHGHAFASSSTITLRWRYDIGLQSFQEIFYVVDGCAGYDAMLRKDIVPKPEDAHMPQAHPLVFEGKYRKPEKVERDRKDKEREEQWKREMEVDRDRMRKGIDAAKKARK